MAYSLHDRPAWWLLVRSLLPSGASLVGSFVLTVWIMGLHLFLLSQDAALFLPHFAGRASDDQLAEVYNTVILEPLNRAFGSSALSTITTALVWGVVGWVFYAVADYVILRAKELRRSEREINVQLKNQVVYHPLHRQLVIRLLWRFLIGITMVVATIALQPMIATLFRQDILLLQADSALAMLELAGSNLFGWFAVFHIYVVLFRLFVLRTRVFGEILY